MKSGALWATASGPKAHDRILGFVIDNGSSGATADMIAVLTKSSTSQSRTRLEALVRRKLLVRNGDRYFLRMTKEADDGR